MVWRQRPAPICLGSWIGRRVVPGGGLEHGLLLNCKHQTWQVDDIKAGCEQFISMNLSARLSKQHVALILDTSDSNSTELIFRGSLEEV